MAPSLLPTPIEYIWNDRLGLSYLVAGAGGPAVVLLHGWGAFKELWWSTMGALAPDYRCFALDMPGHGRSTLGGCRSLSDVAQRVADFCADTGLDRVVLVGHSMGGSVAAELALERPDLVERLALVDPAIDAYKLPPYVRIYLAERYGWAAFRFSLEMARRFSPIGQRVPHLHGGGWLLPWLRRSSYLSRHEPQGIRRLLKALVEARLGPRLAGLKQPTLILTGQFDGLVPPGHSRMIAGAIPGAQFAIIPGALHNPMDERPAAFEAVLRAFLEGGR